MAIHEARTIDGRLGLYAAKGTFAGVTGNPAYVLIVADMTANPDLEVIVHREARWTEITAAMRRYNPAALMAGLGSYHDGFQVPLGDLIVNSKYERTWCPLKRFFFARLKRSNRFVLREMRASRGEKVRGKTITSWHIPPWYVGNASYAMGGIFALVLNGKPVSYAAMGGKGKDFEEDMKIRRPRIAYGFSQDSKQFFMVATAGKFGWSAESTRDFFVQELPSVSYYQRTLRAHNAFLADFGSGAHLYSRSGSNFSEENTEGDLGRDLGNIVWLMIKQRGS